MISSAVLVQVKGWQSVFQLSMNLLMAPMRSVTELNAPRRIACLVMMPKKISTMFSQEPEVCVKCIVTRGFCVSPASVMGPAEPVFCHGHGTTLASHGTTGVS